MDKYGWWIECSFAVTRHGVFCIHMGFEYCDAFIWVFEGLHLFIYFFFQFGSISVHYDHVHDS